MRTYGFDVRGDLLGRGCLMRWVVSRPTASLTPHLSNLEGTGTAAGKGSIDPFRWTRANRESLQNRAKPSHSRIIKADQDLSFA